MGFPVRGLATGSPRRRHQQQRTRRLIEDALDQRPGDVQPGHAAGPAGQREIPPELSHQRACRCLHVESEKPQEAS